MNVRSKASFLASYLLSVFGYEFVFFVSILHIFKTTKNPLLAGLLTAFTTLPKFFAPFYGTLTDRFPKERLFRIAALSVAVLVVLMGAVDGLAAKFSFWFLIAFGLAILSNSRTVMMAEVMPGRGFVSGNAGIFISLNIAKLLAPLLAGFAVSRVSSQSLYAISALCYLLAVAATALLDLPEIVKKHRAAGTLEQIRNALTYIRRTPNLLSLRYLLWTKALFLGSQASLYVVYVKSYLGESDFHYGLFMTVISLGSITGALIAAGLGLRLRRLEVIVAGLTFQYASLIGLGFIHSYHAALALMFSSFVFFYIAAIALHSVRDTSTDHAIRGTVYGTVNAIGAPINIVSMLAGTWLAGRFGVEKVYAVGGTLALLSMLGIVLSGNFNLQHAPRKEEDHDRATRVAGGRHELQPVLRDH